MGLSPSTSTEDAEAQSVTKQIFSTSGGLSQLTHALANHIGSEHSSYAAEDCRITRTAEGLYEVQFTAEGTTRTLQARHVITTAPAPALPDLLSFLSTEDLAPITTLRYAPIVQVAWGMRATKLPPTSMPSVV